MIVLSIIVEKLREREREQGEEEEGEQAAIFLNIGDPLSEPCSRAASFNRKVFFLWAAVRGW